MSPAFTKDLLIRDEDVPALRSFDGPEHTRAYPGSGRFQNIVPTGLKPFRPTSSGAKADTAAR